MLFALFIGLFVDVAPQSLTSRPYIPWPWPRGLVLGLVLGVINGKAKMTKCTVNC